MAIIIGAGTTVSFDIADCIISANWAENSNTQRLYCLGSFSPTLSYDKPVQTLSLVVYSGNTGTHDLTPSDDCSDANTVGAVVNPAACAPGMPSFPNKTGNPDGNSWYVTSYGFSKDDAVLPGQETWGLQRWVVGQTSAGDTLPAPNVVVRGIAEGQGTQTTNGDADPGIVFTGVTSESYSGNVSANAVGRNDILRSGVVIQIGGAQLNDGLTGNGSVSIPYTPLWI